MTNFFELALSMILPSLLLASRIPKGFRLKAQGRVEDATLGTSVRDSFYPERVAA
jgi:hypothetical protein